MTVVDEALESHAHDAGHRDPPEVVAGRQTVGVWLLIAGDAVVVASIAFTYMYLRGLNTDKQWMPRGVHGASDVVAWVVVAVAALAVGALWSGEVALRRGDRRAGALAGAAVLLALAAVAVGIVAIRDVPQAVNATSGALQVDGSYASALLAIDVSNVIHLAVVAIIALGVAVRIRRGRITPEAPTHARLARIFTTWVGMSILLVAAMTTLFVTSPH